MTPSTVVDGDTVSYTVFATGPLGLGQVTAHLSPVAQGTGFNPQAFAVLTETATDTWTGTGTIESIDPLLIGGDGYYVWIGLAVDPTGTDLTGTVYTISTTTTRYTSSHTDSAGTEVATSSSAYVIARVTVQ